MQDIWDANRQLIGSVVYKNKIYLIFERPQILSPNKKMIIFFLYLNNEQLLHLLRPVFFLKNSIGYVEAMVVSDSVKLYVRKEIHDTES